MCLRRDHFHGAALATLRGPQLHQFSRHVVKTVDVSDGQQPEARRGILVVCICVYLVHVCQEDQVWEQSTGGISLRKGLICLGKVSS